VVGAGEAPHTRFFPGKGEASKRVELAFQVPGVLVKVPVEEGQKVKAGEVIAQLRQDEFKARLKTLQGQLDQARAGLKALQAGERPEERLRRGGGGRGGGGELNNTRGGTARGTARLAARGTPTAPVRLRRT